LKIRIYQVNGQRDGGKCAFRGFEELPPAGDGRAVDAAVYDLVYEGEADCADLEEVYEMFNLYPPEGYAGRSMSVSDVVAVDAPERCTGLVRRADGSERRFASVLEFTAYQNELRLRGEPFVAEAVLQPEPQPVAPGCYYCDIVGFRKTDFDESAAARCAPERMKVVLLEPGQVARVTEIGGSLEQMQRVVGGCIEAIYPFEEEVCIVCNEEGKLDGLPLNRAVFAEPERTELGYDELVARFRAAEREGKTHLTGYVVFTEDSFLEPYPEAARTYRISSDNKAFRPGMCGYSIFGSALDGSDPMVRLEQYMAAERGGADGWRIERCYLLDDKREMLDIIAGTCFICSCAGEDFGSLTDEQAQRLSGQFRQPERFYRVNGRIEAVPFWPAAPER